MQDVFASYLFSTPLKFLLKTARMHASIQKVHACIKASKKLSPVNKSHASAAVTWRKESLRVIIVADSAHGLPVLRFVILCRGFSAIICALASCFLLSASFLLQLLATDHQASTQPQNRMPWGFKMMVAPVFRITVSLFRRISWKVYVAATLF
jgi:hypothetical protein